MEPILKEKIKVSGFKKNYLAEYVGVTPCYFYMCLAGTRNLSTKKQDKLKTLLNA
jgi:hypothetical protein